MLFHCHKLTTFCLLSVRYLCRCIRFLLSLAPPLHTSFLQQGYPFTIQGYHGVLLLPLLNFYYLNPHFGVFRQKIVYAIFHFRGWEAEDLREG